MGRYLRHTAVIGSFLFCGAFLITLLLDKQYSRAIALDKPGSELLLADHEWAPSMISDKNLDPKIRYWAIHNIPDSPDQETLNALFQVLNDPDEPRIFRINAARGLARNGNVSFIPDVANIIDGTEDDNLSYGLASALGESDSPESVELLISLSRNAKNSTLRYKAIQSLMKIADPVAIDTLKRCAENDTDKYNRAKAILALGKIGSFEVLPFLKSRADEENDDFVKHVCKTEIERISSK